jgi:NTP pyrophosphatase (non-canonical NTP hydrolase)
VSIGEYIRWTDTTAIYPKEREQEYLRLGLLSEVGEVAGVLKRRVRDGEVAPEKLLAEIGDLLWYLARLHRNPEIWSEAAKLDTNSNGNIRKVDDESLGDIDTLVQIAALADGPLHTVSRFLRLLQRHNLTLDEVIVSNTAKLEGRKQRNTIHGAGDER